MTNTNPKDFKKFLNIIPKSIEEKVWFIPLRGNSKMPSQVGTFKNNLNYRLSGQSAYMRLKNGQNVGICALTGGLIFLDLDVSEQKIIASQELVEKLDATKTVKIRSRNGGLQYYFLNDGKYKNQLIYENGIIIGELRADWWYVVSVGSYVDTDKNNYNGDGIYRILSGEIIKPFSDNIMEVEKIEKIENNYNPQKNISPVMVNNISDEEYNNMIKNKRRIKV